MVDTPYKGIIDAAKKHKCDVIFMASHGRRGVSGLLMGSVTQKVLTHCKIPVLVFR
jgi:nucleotide-binding universal stress UspA family protein